MPPENWTIMLAGSALALLLALVVAAAWAVRQLPRVEPVRVGGGELFFLQCASARGIDLLLAFAFATPL